MSYYVVRKITCNEEMGKLSVTAADSSVHPLTFFTSEYMDKEMDFSKRAVALIAGIYDGNFQLRKGANEKFSRAASCMDEWMSEVSEDLFSMASKYRDYSMHAEAKEVLAALAYQVCFKGEKENIREEILSLAEKNREWLAKKEKEWKEQGLLSIHAAIRSSIFPGYNVLIDCNERLILAPEEDYTIGILKKGREIVFEQSGEHWFYLLADTGRSRPDDYEDFETAVLQKTGNLAMAKLPYPSFPIKDIYIKIPGKDKDEYIGQVIDVFEDWLAELIGSEEAVIEGTDYDDIAKMLSKILARWQTDESSIWMEYQHRIDSEEDKYHVDDVLKWLCEDQMEQCQEDGFVSKEQMAKLAEEIVSVNRHAQNHYGSDPEWLYGPDGLSDAYAEAADNIVPAKQSL